jgi:hypothetical protein
VTVRVRYPPRLVRGVRSSYSHRYAEVMHINCTLLAAFLVLNASVALGQAFVPDRERTPGPIDPGIKQESVAETICIHRAAMFATRFVTFVLSVH